MVRLRPAAVAASFAAALLLLSACGSSSETASVCTKQYWNGTVGACLPDGWTVMESERLAQMGVPEDVLAGFQTEKPVAGQYPTVVITREVLAQPMDAATYSRASQRAVSVLPGYEIIDTWPVTIDGSAVTLHIFSASPADGQPKIRAYQVSTVSPSGTGFTISGFAPLTVSSSLDRQETAIVSSLTFKEPGKK